jgi:hypothetical protein
MQAGTMKSHPRALTMAQRTMNVITIITRTGTKMIPVVPRTHLSQGDSICHAMHCKQTNKHNEYMYHSLQHKLHGMVPWFHSQMGFLEAEVIQTPWPTRFLMTWAKRKRLWSKQ